MLKALNFGSLNHCTIKNIGLSQCLTIEKKDLEKDLIRRYKIQL